MVFAKFSLGLYFVDGFLKPRGLVSFCGVSETLSVGWFQKCYTIGGGFKKEMLLGGLVSKVRLSLGRSFKSETFPLGWFKK